MQRQNAENIILILGIALVLGGVLANPWLLDSITRLTNGNISVLRVGVLLLFSAAAIIIGIYWITHRKALATATKKIVFSVVMMVLLLLAVEGLLWAASWVSPTFDDLLSGTAVPLMISDPRLGHRPNPDFPEHDARGFRNTMALVQADIVALGDSQTYGMGVKRHQAWPHQLSRLSRRSVYSMSFGGYGSVEALAMMEDAVALNPKLIIFAAYNGNDIADAFNTVYNLDLYPELKSDGPLRAAVEEREKSSPLFAEIKSITARMWNNQANEQQANEQDDAQLRQLPSKGAMHRIKQLKLIRLFFAVERIIENARMRSDNRRWRAAKQASASVPDLCEIFDDGGFKTLFTPAYRHTAMNLDDPRIVEGLEISLRAMERMNHLTEAMDIAYLVLLIPTKERVFYELYSQYDLQTSEAMGRLVHHENIIRDRTIDFLNEQGIAYIDMLPVLRRCFDQGRKPFFPDADGHLNAIGQRAAAQAVNSYMNMQKRVDTAGERP